jgi:hypothetical protein
MGTPKEIQALLAAGYADRLRVSENNDPSLSFTVIMPRSDAEGRDGRCVFYRNFQCLLHAQGLKPIEGRVALHDYRTPRLFYHHLARAWNGKRGLAVVRQFRELSRNHSAG